MSVNGQEIRETLRGLGLTGRAVCLHGSLRSRGHVEGGAEAFVRAFLEEGCTVLVPTFSSAFEVAPPPHLRFRRNGWDYTAAPERENSGRVYSPESSEVDREMGAIPAAVLATPGRVRGRNPLDSFAALGPRAADAIRSEPSITHCGDNACGRCRDSVAGGPVLT